MEDGSLQPRAQLQRNFCALAILCHLRISNGEQICQETTRRCHAPLPGSQTVPDLTPRHGGLLTALPADPLQNGAAGSQPVPTQPHVRRGDRAPSPRVLDAGVKQELPTQRDICLARATRFPKELRTATEWPESLAGRRPPVSCPHPVWVMPSVCRAGCDGGAGGTRDVRLQDAERERGAWARQLCSLWGPGRAWNPRLWSPCQHCRPPVWDGGWGKGGRPQRWVSCRAGMLRAGRQNWVGGRGLQAANAN